MQTLSPVLAVLATMIAGAILFAILGKSPLEAIRVIFVDPLLDPFSRTELLVIASPLILIALGLSLGFRAGVWNIGAEGQLIIGAILASIVAIQFDGSTSSLLLPAMVLAGALGGMGWAGIAAWLRTRYNANEILVTFMLSSIALQVLYYLVTGPLRDPDGFNFPQSITFSAAATFPLLIENTRVNASLLIALVVSVVAWVFMQRSLMGYKLVVGGLAPQAARYAGFGEKRAIWLALLIGGAAAGVAGVGEVAGPLGMLQRTISPGYGFTAIIVAFLGGLHPIGIIFSSALMALIYVGGDFARLSVGLPSAVTDIFQGLLLTFYLASSLLLTHRLRVRESEKSLIAEAAE